MLSAGSTAVTCAYFWTKGIARVPGPAPISRTREFSLISIFQMIWSMRLLSFRHMFLGRRALSRLSQMRAQSRTFLIHLAQEDQWNFQTQLIHFPRDEESCPLSPSMTIRSSISCVYFFKRLVADRHLQTDPDQLDLLDQYPSLASHRNTPRDVL